MTPELTRRTFYFLRHGETDWNRRRIMQGHTNTDLSAYGVAQAADVAGAVAALPVKTICVSPLLRARRTAEIVNERLGAPTVIIDDLKECGFGIYEGQASDGPWREGWLKGESIPNGEKYDDYLLRAMRGLNAALAHVGPVLVVAHGGTFWAIDKFALNDTHVRVANCTLFKLEPPQSGESAWHVTELARPKHEAVAIGEERT
jgi:broad specificity phosphatase PhoE